MSTTTTAPARITWRNWGRTLQVDPVTVVEPASAVEVRDIVRDAAAEGRRVKAVGAGHSFTAIAEAGDIMMTLDRLHGLIRVNSEAREVTFAAGTRLHAIPALLAPYGLAMENLGDIDRQSIAGAISTGTHGTGAAFRGLAAQVVGVVIVTGRGDLLRVDADHNSELLPAVALGLGASGILVEITVRCVRAFDLSAVQRTEPLHRVLGSLPERVLAADHFEFFWFPHTELALTKTNTRVTPGGDRTVRSPLRRWVDDTLMANGAFRASCAVGRIAPGSVPAINRVAARLAGERSFTDASSSVFATQRNVRFTEMEYAIPAEHVLDAFRDVQAAIDRAGWRISFPVEVRFAASDDLWMSTAYGRASAYIAVHRVIGEDPRPYFRAVEEIMRRYDGRPHWGKMHWRTAEELADIYPRFDDFVALRGDLDPDGVFMNDHLRQVLGD